MHQQCIGSSELDFHVWNANWSMKSEDKLVSHGGQSCTSVSVPYAVLYVSFCLPTRLFRFLKSFLWKYSQNMSSKYISVNMSVKIYFDKVKLSLRLYIFSKINHQTHKKSDKTGSKNYLRKLLSARPFFTVSLPSSDSLVHFLGHTVIMNPSKYMIM